MIRLTFLLLFISNTFLFSQTTGGSFNKDPKTGCEIWCKYASDNVSWTGPCKNNKAEGTGTAVWSENGNEAERYVGIMKTGKPNGQGIITFPDGRTLKGNFVDGEFLNLDDAYLKKLQTNSIDIIDTTDIYVTDGSSKDLFYKAIVPEGNISATLVLLPAAWETVSHAISSTKELCQLAYDNNIAVLYPSVNQHIILNRENLDFLNKVFSDAIKRYNLPKGKFVLGGLSMGGVLSVSYAQLALKDSTKTVVKPKAAFNVDGPADLENLYKIWKENLNNPRNSNKGEANYVITVLDKQMGGPPEKSHPKYLEYSIFSKSEKDGGNAKFLKDFPIRIYNDVDVNWWINNRGEDLYGMNALDQSAMINNLIGNGNKKAEFINAFGKGFRIEGNRHPHSWSIVDPKDCIQWILNLISI
jgi:hypothetical protein